MKFTVTTEQPCNIIHEYTIDAKSEDDAMDIVRKGINGQLELPDPEYDSKDFIGKPEVISAYCTRM
jgi:hypothetical protein